MNSAAGVIALGRRIGCQPDRFVERGESIVVATLEAVDDAAVVMRVRVTRIAAERLVQIRERLLELVLQHAVLGTADVRGYDGLRGRRLLDETPARHDADGGVGPDAVGGIVGGHPTHERYSRHDRRGHGQRSE
jgi:hypothetical protein